MAEDQKTIKIADSASGRRCVQINAPELFKDPEFVAWLNGSGNRGVWPCATWHSGGIPGEMSDIFMTVDYPHEGSDSDMPEHCWNAIVERLAAFGCDDSMSLVVWLTNLDS